MIVDPSLSIYAVVRYVAKEEASLAEKVASISQRIMHKI